MKCGFRIIICAALLACSLLYLLGSHLWDLGNQYHAGAYLMDWWSRSEDHSEAVPFHGPPGDKAIVMAKLEEEDTDWVAEELPEYVVSHSSPVKSATDTVCSQVATSALRRQSVQIDLLQRARLENPVQQGS